METEGPSPQQPEQPPPPVTGVELAIGVTIVLLCALAVVGKLQPAPGPSELTGEDTLQRAQALWKDGRGKVLAACLAAIAAGAVACLGLLLTRGAGQLRRALQRRVLGRLSVAHLLIAIGVSAVFQSAAQLGQRSGPRWVAGERSQKIPRLGLRFSETVEQVVGPGGLGEGKALLTWRMGQGLLRVGQDVGDARVAGKPVPKGHTVEVWPGERVEVGSLAGRVEGGGWDELAPITALGFGLGLVGLILCCLAGDVPLRRVQPGGAGLLTLAGFHTAGLKREVLRGIVGYLGFLPIFLLVVLFTQWLAAQLSIPAESHSLVRALERYQSSSLTLLVVFQAVALAPLLEELLLRGFGLPAFERAFGPASALLVTALVFAVMHSGFSSLLPMFSLGLLFGALRLTSETDSIVGSITAHAMHNGLVLALVLGVQAS